MSDSQKIQRVLAGYESQIIQISFRCTDIPIMYIVSIRFPVAIWWILYYFCLLTDQNHEKKKMINIWK